MIAAFLRRHAAPLVLLAVALLAYANALLGDFQFDDYNVIVENPWVHTWTAWLLSMPGARPLLKASYTFNWSIAPAPLGFLVFNVAVHAVNVLLVYALMRRLVERARDASAAGGPGGAPVAAVLVAALFALHPVNTEAVTYISGRSSALSATLYLASLLAYAQGCAEDGRRGWMIAHVVSALLFLAALAVKETAVTLPFALMLWDAVARPGEKGPCAASGARWRPWHHAPGDTRVHAFFERYWMHWIALALALGTMAAIPRYRELLMVSIQTRGLVENLLTQAQAVFYLVGQLFMPWRTNIDPDLPVIAELTLPAAGVAIALLLTLLAGFMLLERRSLIGFGLLWFFLSLAPTNSLLPRLDVANDRQLYLAAIGLFLIAALAIERVVARGIKGAAAAAAVLLALGIVTGVRNLDYRSEVALWQDTVRKSPGKSRAWHNLGYAFYLAGRYAEAERAYERALTLQPDNWQARVNLGILRRAFATGVVPPVEPDE